MLSLAGLIFISLLKSSLCDDTVADDIGSHMMDRISDLLSPEECQIFYAKLISPEKENSARRRRDISSPAQCRGTLNHWLKTEGDTMYWDGLSQALQSIGRSDVYLELGKNLNQDKNLEIKKNVEDYHKTVKHLTSTLLLEENEMNGPSRLRREEKFSRVESALDEWDDLELIIERKPLPPYNRSIFGWVTPVVTGVVGGFLTSFVLVALAIYSFFWILHEGRSTTTGAYCDSVPDMIFPSPPSRRGSIYYIHQQHDELNTYASELAEDVDDDVDVDEEEEEEEEKEKEKNDEKDTLL